MNHRSLIRIFMATVMAVLLSGSIALACACSGGGGGGSPSSCITTLPVNFTFPSPFAASYRHFVPVTITSQGPPIRNLSAALYTFSNVLIAKGKFGHTIFSSNKVPMKLHLPFQAGDFTLALFGEPNANPSCGPKHEFKVVHFISCLPSLPVTFPRVPSGNASDFSSGQLNVDVKSTGMVLHGVTVALSNFNGQVFGVDNVGTLYGTQSAIFKFPNGVKADSYTVTVSGSVQNAPRSCGFSQAKTTFTLK